MPVPPTIDLQVRNQHTKLGTPITHVVLPNHFVAHKLKYTDYRVTNNGAAQMSNIAFPWPNSVPNNLQLPLPGAA